MGTSTLLRVPRELGRVGGQGTYRSTSRMRLVSLFTTWISSSVWAKFTRPFLSTWNWGETARSPVWERSLLLSMPRDVLAWQETLKHPSGPLQYTPTWSVSVTFRAQGRLWLSRRDSPKGDFPSSMWKVTYPSKQPPKRMVTCTSSVLTMAPVMLESRLMNSSSNCLTLSGISLMMILTLWSSRRM